MRKLVLVGLMALAIWYAPQPKAYANDLVDGVYTVGVIYRGLDLNVAKSVLAPFEFLVVTFGVSYLAVRKAGNGAGT